jgi:hypothetical protein
MEVKSCRGKGFIRRTVDKKGERERARKKQEREESDEFDSKFSVVGRVVWSAVRRPSWKCGGGWEADGWARLPG